MNKWKYFWFRLIEKICQRFRIIHIYESKVGIKGIYGLKSRPYTPISNAVFECTPERIFLGIDYLKDKYTLLNCPLLDSPHYALMKALQGKQDLSQTDYFRRYESGTLDGRVASLKHSSYEYFEKAFAKRVEEISHSNEEPVYVYRIGDKTYIYDGKHRAALCALLGKTIKCQEVCKDQFGYAYNLIKGKDSYSKHLTLFQQYIEGKLK